MKKADRLTQEEARDYFDLGTVGLDGVIVPRYQYESPQKPELPDDPSIDGFRRGIDRIEKLHRALTNHAIPQAVPFEKWECRFCPYKKECPRGEKNE